MTHAMLRGILAGVVVSLVAVAATAQTTTKTEKLSGTVVEVDGGTLIVKMDSGDIRTFTPPADRVFVIDGKELKLSQLQPGTKLNATIQETATATTVKTVETLEGTVVYASGPTVILRLPTNERRQYNIKSTDPVKFYDPNGKEMTVFDLRKNMNIKATKITEAPSVELAANTTVTGTAPAAAAAGAGTQAAQAARPAAAPAAQPPAAQPAAAQDQVAATGEKPKKLPPTGSQLPLLLLTGIASLAVGLSLTVLRRR
jgi:hypothetical protein